MGRIKGRNLSSFNYTKFQLIERFIHVWFYSVKIKDLCHSLIVDMTRRVQALLSAEACQTKY